MKQLKTAFSLLLFVWFSLSSSCLGMDIWNQSVLNVDGKQIVLKESAGDRATVLAFWCNHCPYVKKYENRMIDIARDYNDKGVSFIALNPNDPVKYPGDSFEKMQEVAKDKQYPFVYAVDASAALARHLKATKTPHIYVYDAQKQLVYVGTIDDNVEDAGAVKKQYLREVLDAVLQGAPLPYTETKAVGCTIKWPN